MDRGTRSDRQSGGSYSATGGGWDSSKDHGRCLGREVGSFTTVDWDVEANNIEFSSFWYHDDPVSYLMTAGSAVPWNAGGNRSSFCAPYRSGHGDCLQCTFLLRATKSFIFGLNSP